MQGPKLIAPDYSNMGIASTVKEFTICWMNEASTQ